MIGTLEEFSQTVSDLIKETLWWNIWGNQILSWSRDRNTGYLSINCSSWITLNLILKTSIRNIIHEIFGHEVPYHFQNAIKGIIINDQYNKDNAYWANLFTCVKSWIKKIGMDMMYLSIFNFWGYIFPKYK